MKPAALKKTLIGIAAALACTLALPALPDVVLRNVTVHTMAAAG